MAYVSMSDVNTTLVNRSCFSAIHLKLRRNFDNITTFVHSFDQRFSVICVSETWLSVDDKDIFNIPGYKGEYGYRDGSSHGGSAIFVLNGIAYKRRSDLNLNVPSCESVWVEFEASSQKHNSPNIVCGAIYRSPSSDPALFSSMLSDIFHKLSQENKTVFVFGDININLLDDSNHHTLEYIASIYSYGYQCLITVPTRCPNHSTHSLMDHILTNSSSIIEAGVIETDITDHYPVFMTANLSVPVISKTCFSTIFDADKYTQIISVADWSAILNTLDPEIAVQKLYEIITSAIDSSTSVMASNRRYQSPRCPWLSNGLLRFLRKKENLYKKN